MSEAFKMVLSFRGSRNARGGPRPGRRRTEAGARPDLGTHRPEEPALPTEPAEGLGSHPRVHYFHWNTEAGSPQSWDWVLHLPLLLPPQSNPKHLGPPAPTAPPAPVTRSWLPHRTLLTPVGTSRASSDPGSPSLPWVLAPVAFSHVFLLPCYIFSAHTLGSDTRHVFSFLLFLPWWIQAPGGQGRVSVVPADPAHGASRAHSGPAGTLADGIVKPHNGKVYIKQIHT